MDAAIGNIKARAFSIPTDSPESDGTLTWDRTTLITVDVEAGAVRGFGYTYCAAAAVPLISKVLAPELEGRDAFDIEAAWLSLAQTVRNVGRPGIAACAISAIDIALWDAKAKLLNVPLTRLLGATRADVPVYGSGGFTSYDDDRLRRQLSEWTQAGCRFVKMKVGRDPTRDLARVEVARSAIGDAALFVDANGAYSRKHALAFSADFARHGVSWFEEPVSSDDLEGLRLLRDRATAPIEIAAGEYCYTPGYFRRMLSAGAVDVLQADATRCGGITGFLRAATLAEAFSTCLSSHCAPSAHLAAACATPALRHMEWFHDHVRIEQMLFEGAPELDDGTVSPDPARAGSGISLREKDAARYEVGP